MKTNIIRTVLAFTFLITVLSSCDVRHHGGRGRNQQGHDNNGH